MRKPVLGILLGDAAGIGPEVTAKFISSGKWKDKYIPIIIGSKTVFENTCKNGKHFLEYSLINQFNDNYNSDGITLLDTGSFEIGNVIMGQPSRESGKAIIAMIECAVSLCMEGKVGGFTYAPFNKKAINMADSSHTDELHIMRKLINYDGLCLEMNMADSLWTSRVTGHIPISEVGASLTKDKIAETIRLSWKSLKKMGIDNPRIFVAALNPHGGEGGLFGTEESNIIKPAIETVSNEGINAAGPYPADTIFMRAFEGACDCVVTMYHDQGQIALKSRHFGKGITLLAGLPFIATTPAHGTGYDIAGKGIAKTESMELALDIAAAMAAFDYKKQEVSV